MAASFPQAAVAVSILAISLPAFAASPQPAGWVVLFQDNLESGIGPWQAAVADEGAAWRLANAGENTVFSGEGHTWLRLPGYTWGDHRFRSRIKLLGGSLHINYRMSGCGRYFVNFSSGGITLAETRADCSSAGVVARATGTYASDSWHDVEIVGVGGAIRIYVNGVLKLDYTDPVPLTWGAVAFECLSGRVMVDDVEISGPPAPAMPGIWTKTGGPHGGMGYDIKMRSGNPDQMYVTDVFSGVNRSADGGRNWVAANQGIAARAGTSGDSVPIFCLSIDPNNPDVVWAGTQNARGIYKSTDGGDTWTEKVNGIVERISVSFRGITVDPRNSNVVYAAAEIGSAEWAGGNQSFVNSDKTKGVVYRSADGGENWKAIWRGDHLARYVVIDPRDSNVLYVSTGIFDRWAANSDPTAGVEGGVGIVKSTDGGATWTILGPSSGLLGTYVGSLFMHPRNPDILLAGAGHASSSAVVGGGIYLTTDGGQHWQLRQADSHITSVEFAFSDPSIAYAASFESFYRSTDGGRTWRKTSGSAYGPPGVKMGWPIDLQVDPRDPNRVFLNAYGGGAFLTLDGGATWQVASKGYTGAQLRDIALDPRDPSRVYTVGRSGPFRSDNRGADWQGIHNNTSMSTEPAAIAVDPANSGTLLFMDDMRATIMRSVNGGLTWSKVYTSPFATGTPDTWFSFRSVAFAPSNPRTVYAGMSRDYPPVFYQRNPDPSHGIWKSTDSGLTWQEANDPVSATENILRIVVDPSSDNVAYAATFRSGVIRTADGGRSWQPAKQGLPNTAVYALALDPAHPAVLYAGVYRSGIYKSVDGGVTWKRSSAGMDPQTIVRDIVVDPTTSGIVYASSENAGVFRSTDGGGLWVQINTGLRHRSVVRMALSPDGGTLYTANDGEGVYRLDMKPAAESAVTALNAASFLPGSPAAPNSIVSLYGAGLAATLVQSGPGALPDTLGETSVGITDSVGTDFWTSLYFVSPGQINLVLPAGAKSGPAQIRVFRQGPIVSRGSIQIDQVAPGLFTATADGKGAPAALVLRIAGGSQTLETYRSAIDLGALTDQVILELFGTGIRNARAVTVTIGVVEAPVLGFSAQSQYPGLDQVNVRIPYELKGRGEVDLFLKADGIAANTVRIRIQ